MATVAFILLVTAVAARYGTVSGPVVTPFVPIASTAWALADALTAFLLFARSYVRGQMSFGIAGAAYLLSAMLTAPYLFTFPRLFLTGTTSRGDDQVSIYLWSAWHLAFPLIITLGIVLGKKSEREPSVRSGGRATGLLIAGTAGFATLISGLVYAGRNALPPLVEAGHFLPAFTLLTTPAIAVVNVLACIYLWRRVRVPNGLQAGLMVAMLATAADAFLNSLSPGRFSYTWYVGKLDALLTANVVLFILLTDITLLYRRLSAFASVDALTGLANRRSFAEHFGWTLGNTQRRSANIALLMIDIDHFKAFNDRRGHSAGDECLRAVGAVLQASLERAQDLVGRYGGEEFVVVLPDTPLEGARVVAERIRAGVAALAVHHNSIALGSITISIGGAFSRSSTVDAAALFDAADRAMYDAKQSGRDRVVFRELHEERIRIPAA